MCPGGACVGVAAQFLSLQSFGKSDGVPLCSAPTFAAAHTDLATSSAGGQSDDALRGVLMRLRAVPQFAETMMPRCLLLLAILTGIASVRAEVPWQSVRGADLRDMFIDHELAYGAHYA